jgi:DNA modification methylase
VLNYQDFLASKRVIAQTSGLEVSLDDIHDGLFPFQKVLVQWSLRKGRAAIFSDTGTGKTRIQVEWSHLVNILTSKRVLILAPLSVARQTVSEAAKIGVHVHYTRLGDDLVGGINITNYEMLSHFNPDDFGAIVLDESSCLKAIESKTRVKLIEMFQDTPYKLCCTATPAPNDITEIANHAEFLGISTRGKMLSMFFIHDGMSTARDGWRLKGHAHEAFYQWLASWSMSVKKPSDIGDFSDKGYNLPPLHIEPCIVRSDYVPEGQLFFAGLKGIQERTKARKGTIAERVEETVKLVNSNQEQWIIWCGLNDESATVTKAIPGAIEIVGSDSSDKKIKAIEDFQDGKIRVLVSKPSIFGYGINLQNCSHMVFLGLGDSYELYYQSIRRCYRFGQVNPVHAYIVLSEVEEEIFQNVKRKEEEAQNMSKELIKHVQQFERDEIENNIQKKSMYQEDASKNDNYHLMLGDSCQRLKELEDNSVDNITTSPPFAHIYTYTDLPHDLSNNVSTEAFYQHFNYIVDEMLRVLKPGRNACIHVAQLPATKMHDGFIGMHDFRGQIIQAFSGRGFQYFGDITIDKNAQIQATRSKRKNLLFVQLNKDSAWMSPCFADYLIIFKKPGENAVPIKTDVTEQEWIEWAKPIWKGAKDNGEVEFPDDWTSPVWYNIRETDVLNVIEAREKKDEKHVCPLQLGLIERCIRLWSNPGEIILDPFTGIGSTGYVAIQQRRRFVGCELKPSYYKTACKNIEKALNERTQTSLWDFAEVS